MIYDGWLVAVNADGGINMLIFKSKKAAKRFVEQETARHPQTPPMMQGFEFVPDDVEVIQ